MDGDAEDDVIEEENVRIVSTAPQEEVNVVEEILDVIDIVKTYGNYRRTQRKECYNLVRRMKLLLPLLEEIRDLEGPIPDVGIDSLCNLRNVLLSANKLLRNCNEGSKIYLVRILFLFLFFEKILVGLLSHMIWVLVNLFVYFSNFFSSQF